MRLRDLVTDAGGKTFSHTKIWSNIAYAAATAAFIKQAWAGTITAEIWWAYLGCVASAATASKYLSLKYRHPVGASYTEPSGPYGAYPSYATPGAYQQPPTAHPEGVRGE